MSEDIKWPTAGDLVAALRSGEYRQHEASLCDTDRTEHDINDALDKAASYCCIGVYGKLCRDAGYTFQHSIEVYEACAKATGVDNKNLFMRNDGISPHTHHDFNQIADYIEEHAK